MPAATAAADPPLLPPGVIAGFHGLRVTPVALLSVRRPLMNSGEAVLPTGIAPAARKRATCGATHRGPPPLGRPPPPPQQAPELGRHPHAILGVLDAERDSSQRTGLLPPGDRRVYCLRGPPGGSPVEVDEGSQLSVAGLGPLPA